MAQERTTTAAPPAVGTPVAGAPLLELRGIEKSFPGVTALRDMSLTIQRGAVHCVVGENGAGKSTLMKIINGIYQPDKGEIRMQGHVVQVHSPLQARALGISMISQELNYIPEITVEQALFLGNEPLRRFRAIDWKRIRRATVDLLEREGLPYRPTTKLKDLTVSDIQMLEILKAVSYESNVIIMDEPTSAITANEVERLFAKIQVLRARGTAIIYISHKLEEIFRIADEVSVIRDGSLVETRPASGFDIDTLIQFMVGRTMSNIYPPREPRPLGPPLLEVSGLTQRPRFEGVSFKVHAGEIVGFAGLMGAGRTEVVRSLFGLDPLDAGVVKVRGQEVEIRSVQDAIELGMVMLSEDRKRYGVVPVRSVRENVGLPALERYIHGGYLHRAQETRLVGGVCERMRVKTPSYETSVDALSGGNQQKVVFAKWMLREPDVLLLDEPTRGIDVGAKFEIYKIMIELAKEGKAVLMISSELPELIGVCDRIYVMAKGRTTGELLAENFSQDRVMRFATIGAE